MKIIQFRACLKFIKALNRSLRVRLCPYREVPAIGSFSIRFTTRTDPKKNTFLNFKQAFSIAIFLINIKCIAYSQNGKAKPLKIGDKYRNFSAEALDGKSINISDSINGKIAIIHLWSPWCHPSRNAGKALIPIYEKYKQNGLIIISTANVKDTTTFKKALNDDKTPWLNLVDINSKNNVWKTHGIMDRKGREGGGGGYLIDENGLIIAYSNSPVEIDKILSTKYKTK